MKTYNRKRWLTRAVAAAAMATGGQAFAAITSMNASNDSTNIEYVLKYDSPGGFYHAYIDCDQTFTTGYQTTYGVGADYLIENGQIHSWAGSGFNWNPGVNVTYTNTNNTIIWIVPRAALPAPCSSSGARVVFEVTHPGATNEVSLVMFQSYLSSSSGLTMQFAYNDASNAYYQVNYTGTWAFYHVFIDSDQNPATGYPVGGIGADYFVENGNLYKHTVGTTGWDWQLPPTAVPFSASNGTAMWTVGRSLMGETQADEHADLVFHVQDSNNVVTVTLPKQTHYYTGGTGLPKPQPAQTLVPLYVPPPNVAWDNVVSAHSANPTVPITVIANPASGPGSTASPAYTTAINNLRTNGIHVAGYVNSARGTRDPAAVDADVNTWKTLYPNVDGIFFDLMATTVGFESYYQQRTSHAKGDGFAYVIANPGQDVPPTYVGTVDTIVVYEHNGDTTPMSTWWASYPRNQFAVIPYNVPSLDTTFISSAKQHVGYVYTNSEPDDLYNQLTGYFSSLLGQLAIAPPP